MSELAFTVNGEVFDVPNTVSAWRVRRLKPRGAPELVYARDGRPLTLPIEADLDDLHEAVSSSGKYRLDPIGDDGKGVENVPAAYIQVTKGERNAAGDHAIERAGESRLEGMLAALGQAVMESVKLNAEALRQNSEIAMRSVDKIPQLMDAVTTMINVASGTGLHALQQRELPPPRRNAANDNGDDADEDEDEDQADDEEGGRAAKPSTLGGFPMPPGLDINKVVAQVAYDVVSKVIDRFSGKMPSLGSIFDLRKAYAEGERERAEKAAALQAPMVTPSPAPPIAPAPPSARPMPAAASAQRDASVLPTDPASMMHFLAVKNALTREEQLHVVALAQALSDAERAMWFNELRELSVPDAIATVRATLTRLNELPRPTATAVSSAEPAHTTPLAASPPAQAAPTDPATTV